MTTEPAAIAIPQFIAGKVLFLQLPSSTAVITDTRFETIAGRLFAVGITPWGSSPETKDKAIAVAWNQVEQFYLFDSLEEWRAASGVWDKEKQRESKA